MSHTDQIIAESIDYLVAHYADQPELEFLAKRAGYEAAHFQKLFKQKVGISPKRLAQYMTMRHARELLEAGSTTEDAAQASGLSGTGRLYDLFVTCEALTPGDIGFRCKDVDVVYGWHASPLGEILVAQTERGVCYLGFAVDASRKEAEFKMKKHLPEARFTEDSKATKKASDQIMTIWRGEGNRKNKLALDLHGTNLQIQVWQALLRIPLGETLTYGDIAKEIKRPKASRAVGNAVGSNPVSLLIPCHRVIRSTGIIDNYGWGSPRKKLILAVESSILT